MELHDPVKVYAAASNLEAHQLAEELLAAGIESQVIEDNAAMGVLEGGLNSTSHHPEVWISSADLERASVVVLSFEAEARRPQALLGDQMTVELRAEWIDATCDKCGTVTRFAPIQKGTVENCPNCFAFMDVGSDVDFDDWNVIEHEGDEEEPESNEEIGEEAPE